MMEKIRAMGGEEEELTQRTLRRRVR